MLIKGRFIVGLALLLASYPLTHAQLAADTPPAADAVPVDTIDQGPLVFIDPAQFASTTGRWGIDPVTWEVVGPPEDADALKLYNSPDQAEARRLAALAFTDPDEYLRLFPKTPEQLAAEAQAEDDITHPKTYDEHRARQTKEQNADEDALLAAFASAIARNNPPAAPAPAPVNSNQN